MKDSTQCRRLFAILRPLCQAEGDLRTECGKLVEAVYQRGELSRGDPALAMGLEPRTSSGAIRQLVDAGLVTSPSEKGKLRLRFGADAADALFPRLFLAEHAGG